MPSHTGSSARDGVRNLGYRTGDRLRGLRLYNCNRCPDLASTADASQRVHRGPGAPDGSRQLNPVGIRPNRHSLTALRLNNSGVQRAVATRCRFASLSVDPIRLRQSATCRDAKNDLRPALDLQVQVPHAPGQRLCHGPSAMGSLDRNTARDNQRLFRPELSLGLLRDNSGMQLVQSDPIPTKGHVANPDRGWRRVLNPANRVSIQPRNWTRAHPCSRYLLLPWPGPGNSTYCLVYRCEYTQRL